MQRGPSLETLLAADDELSAYGAVLEKERIDSALAKRMSVADWRALIPTAPFGHCLRLHQLAATSEELYPVVPGPEEPGWRFVASLLTGEGDDNRVLEMCLRNFEMMLLVSSLLLTMAVDQLLNYAPSCDADGCSTLLWVDHVLWVVVFTMLISTVFLAMAFNCYYGMFLTPTTAPRFVLENWALDKMPLWTLLTATYCMFPAVGVRAWIILDGPRGLLACVILGAMYVSLFTCGLPLILSRLLGIKFFQAASGAGPVNYGLLPRMLLGGSGPSVSSSCPEP